MNKFGRNANALAGRAAKCGEAGTHANVCDRDLFIFDRLRDGWTKQDCAWALGISMQAIDQRLTRIRRAIAPTEEPTPSYREIHDGTGVWWRYVDGGYQYRILEHGTWRVMSAEDAAAVVHPLRLVAMADVKAKPVESNGKDVAA